MSQTSHTIDYEAGKPAIGVLGSLVAHLLVLMLVVAYARERPLGTFTELPQGPMRLFLGYPGPPHYVPVLEPRDANSTPSPIYQAPRPGRGHPQRSSRDLGLTRNPGLGAMPLGKPGTPDASPSDSPEPLPALEPLYKDIATSDELQIVRLVKPVYPEYELSRRIRARIVVAGRVTPEGTVEDQQIQQVEVTPAGSSSRGFELAVLEALSQWRLRLPKRYEKAQGFWITIPVEFSPDDKDFSKLEAVQMQ